MLLSFCRRSPDIFFSGSVNYHFDKKTHTQRHGDGFSSRILIESHPRTHSHPRYTWVSEEGFMLMEAMVALAIFSVGVLGVFASQTAAYQENHQSFLQTGAGLYTRSIAELIRSNSIGAYQGIYDHDLTFLSLDTTADNSDFNVQQENELRSWRKNIAFYFQGLEPATSIACEGSHPLLCLIQIQWNNHRSGKKWTINIPEPEASEKKKGDERRSFALQISLP